jgi:hypothetical protein
MLILNIVGYYFYGLTGLGVSMLISYLIYLGQVFVIAAKKFEFKIHHEMYTIFLVQFMLAFLSFLTVMLICGSISYFIGSFLFLISLYYSYQQLDRRIDIWSLIQNIKGKYIK